MRAPPVPCAEPFASVSTSTRSTETPAAVNSSVQSGGLGVLRDAVGRVADEAGDVDALGVEAHPLGEEGPELPDLDVLEVVAEAPAAEHLEEGHVPAVADLLDVLGAQAGLAVGEPRALRVVGPEQVGQQRLHAAAREQRGGVVLRDQRRALDHRVPRSVM